MTWRLLFILTLWAAQVNAQQTFSFSAGAIKHRIQAGAVVSMYRNHPHMTEGTRGRMGYSVGYRMELFMKHRTNMLFGLDYVSQRFQFKGYYKAPGNTYVFDGSYPYLHEVRFAEFQSPVAMKVDFNSEKEQAVTPYFVGGIGIRYIVSAYAVVTNDSTGVSPLDGRTALGFEHEYIARGFNFFYHGGLGIQRNRRESGKAIYLEAVFRYGLSRIHYTGNGTSNDLGLKNSFLMIQGGFRF